MCGCSGGSINMGLSTSCSGKLYRLVDLRNKLARIFNAEADVEIKEKLNEDRLLVESIQQQITLTGKCPDLATIILIETEVNNEYTKYYNT